MMLLTITNKKKIGIKKDFVLKRFCAMENSIYAQVVSTSVCPPLSNDVITKDSQSKQNQIHNPIIYFSTQSMQGEGQSKGDYSPHASLGFVWSIFWGGGVSFPPIFYSTPSPQLSKNWLPSTLSNRLASQSRVKMKPSFFSCFCQKYVSRLGIST